MVIIMIIITVVVLIFYGLFLNIIENRQKRNQYSSKKVKDSSNDKNKLLNGEYINDQIIYINTKDVSEIKLPYELISAKKSVIKGQDFIVDDENKYHQLTLQEGDDQTILAIHQDNKELIDKLEEFIKISEFNDEGDLITYYKNIVEMKKLNDNELNEFMIVYNKMKNQIKILHELERSEKINKALNRSNQTSGYEQSKLYSELQESINKKNS